jgi:FkbM family methyltransferase
MKARVLSLLARSRLQPFWRIVHRAALGGLGYLNADSRRNGEHRHLAEWAKAMARDGRAHPVVLDIGANEGDFAAGVLAVAPGAEVHCFEPHPVTYSRLASRFAGDTRVNTQAMGIAERSGSRELHDYEGRTGTAHASLVPGVFRDLYPSATDTVEVPLTTIDDYMRLRSIDHVDLLKIDVEGYEREVLAGAREALAAGRVDRIQFEFNAHHALVGFTLHQVGERLPGFDVYRLLPNGAERILGSGVAYSSRVEVYEYANYVAIRRSP